MSDSETTPEAEDFPTWSSETSDSSARLIVRNGERMPIKSGSALSFSEILIEVGGTLAITGPEKAWTLLRTTGDFAIHGKIEVRGYQPSDQPTEPIERTAPDGEVLQFTYANNKIGGTGGAGGGWVPVPGGSGASGTAQFGGGGGGGAGSDGERNGVRTRGGSASGSSGGAGGAVPGGRGGAGGDGGHRGGAGDGGLLYIRCEGALRGANGTIDLRGGDGTSGAVGSDSSPGRRGGCGGGGGGGSAGHNGGCLVMNVKGDLVSPSVLIDGGLPGDGGSGGSSAQRWANTPAGEPRGKSGEPGQKGNDGSLKIVGDWPGNKTGS
ncbi:MAG TPA: hypothetical protein VHO25_11225 [Polyangiaceae bacterium]|nr:hypothetical protein [Polyangiaceae bacterium]